MTGQPRTQNPLPMDTGAPISTATLSPDGVYRYTLARSWGNGPAATFIMLNPSTADASADDPTIRRCVGFAKAWGCAGIRVANLYALRSTEPRGLWVSADPIGPDNDRHLGAYATDASIHGWPLIAAWGANAKAERVSQVLALAGMDSIQCLGVTKAGHPRHPLYLRADCTPSPWNVTVAP